MAPKAFLQPLQRADGSASYSRNGYSIIAAVNGPIEVQRRDELPEEAAIEVIIRPAVGVGGVRERHFESIIHKTLGHVILTKAHPRTLIQVTLQVIDTPQDDASSGRLPQSASDLALLPPLLQSAILGLVSAAIPLKMMLTSTLVAVKSDGTLVSDPTPKDLRIVASVHVFAFSSKGGLLVAESEGRFDVDLWEKAAAKAKSDCSGEEGNSGDVSMGVSTEAGLGRFMGNTIASKIAADQQWKEDIK